MAINRISNSYLFLQINWDTLSSFYILHQNDLGSAAAQNLNDAFMPGSGLLPSLFNGAAGLLQVKDTQVVPTCPLAQKPRQTSDSAL